MPYNYGNYQGGPYYGQSYGGNQMNNQSYGAGGMNYAQNYNQGMGQMNQMSQAPMQQYSQSMQPQQSNGINWVQGRAGANSFYVAPGQSAILMDSEESVLYVKTVDVTGRPLPLEVYDLVKRENVVDMPVPQISQRGNSSQQASQAPANMNEYVKKEELEKQVNDIVNKAVSKALGE